MLFVINLFIKKVALGYTVLYPVYITAIVIGFHYQTQLL